MSNEKEIKTADEVFQNMNGFGFVHGNQSIRLPKRRILDAMEEYASQHKTRIEELEDKYKKYFKRCHELADEMMQRDKRIEELERQYNNLFELHKMNCLQSKPSESDSEMLFHECPDCNTRCNCSSQPCSCCGI